MYSMLSCFHIFKASNMWLQDQDFYSLYVSPPFFVVVFLLYKQQILIFCFYRCQLNLIRLCTFSQEYGCKQRPRNNLMLFYRNINHFMHLSAFVFLQTPFPFIGIRVSIDWGIPMNSNFVTFQLTKAVKIIIFIYCFFFL